MSIKPAGFAFRRIAILFALLMLSAVLLPACSDNTPTPAASSNSPTAEATANPAASGPGFKLNKNITGTLEFWHFWASPVRRNALRRIIAVCQQELPNIKVTEIAQPISTIYSANTAAVQAGSGMPDVIVEDRPQLPKAAANNIESSLQKYATRDGVNGTPFWPFTWNQTLYNGETYGIPFETDVQVLFWNKNAFKEAGLDPDKPPKTWAEVEAYSAKLTKKNPDGSLARIGFRPPGWDILALANGAQVVSPDAKVNVNDPKIAEALTWDKKIIDTYGGYSKYQSFLGTLAAPPQDALMSGKVAMLIDVNGYASQLNFYRAQYTNPDGTKANLDWGVGDIPTTTGKQISISGGFALSIPRGSKNADAAWEFIKCAAGPQGQLSWGRDTYAMPSWISAAKDPTLLADPNWQYMVNAMNYTSAFPFVTGYSTWKEQVDQRIAKVLPGDLSPQQALQEAQQAIDAEIARKK